MKIRQPNPDKLVVLTPKDANGLRYALAMKIGPRQVLEIEPEPLLADRLEKAKKMTAEFSLGHKTAPLSLEDIGVAVKIEEGEFRFKILLGPTFKRQADRVYFGGGSETSIEMLVDRIIRFGGRGRWHVEGPLELDSYGHVIGLNRADAIEVVAALSNLSGIKLDIVEEQFSNRIKTDQPLIMVVG
ncbi:hypothetical protein ACFL37_01660 [Candidatus Margulisiibacteriota bacterium]